MSSPPPLHRVTWDKKPLRGPDRAFPQSIADFLEKWHKLNPKEKGRPRFTYQQSSPHHSKTFDRQGNEVDVSLFRITRPFPYSVLIMYPVSGPPRLVSSMFPFGTNFGSFLKGWPSDPDQEPDAEPCAVRMFGPAEERITYNPDTWKRVNSELMPRLRRFQETKARGENGQAPSTPDQQLQSEISMLSRIAKMSSDGAAVPTPTASTSAATARTPATAPARATRALGPTDFSNSETDSVSLKEDSSRSDDESADEEEEDESESEDEDEDEDEVQDERPAKRLKTKTNALPSPSKPVQAVTPLEVFFELLYYRIDGSSESCCFPLEACRTVVDLFQRAKAFIPSSLDEINWKILRCEIPDEPPLDIFDKCDWEFERLVERTKNITPGKGPLYIKVRAKLL